MAAVNLRCEQCGYENEAERVYCHNCGGKLDRSLLPKVADDKARESSDKTRRRIRRMTNPGSNPVTREIKALVSTLIWAAIVAALILMVRAPDAVPDPKALGEGRLVQTEISEAVESPVPRSVTFSEADINQALKQSLRGKDGGLIPGLTFTRAFVNLHPGTARVTAQNAIGSYPLYSSATYKVQMKEGKFAPVLIAGSIGRLPVHPQLMQHLDISVKKIWPALKRERGYLERLQKLEAGEGQLTLVTRGATGPR